LEADIITNKNNLSFFNATRGKNTSIIVKLPKAEAELELFKITYQTVGEYSSLLNALSYEADSKNIDKQTIKMDGKKFSLSKLQADIFLIAQSLRVPESAIEDSSIDVKDVEFLIAEIKKFNGMELSPTEIENFFPEEAQDRDTESV
jgi:hypothetical protein